jgi:hypothetical protein
MKYDEIDIASNGEAHPGEEYDEGVLRLTFHGDVPEVLEICVAPYAEDQDGACARVDLWTLLHDAQIEELRKQAEKFGLVVVDTAEKTVVPNEVWRSVAAWAADASYIR